MVPSGLAYSSRQCRDGRIAACMAQDLANGAVKAFADGVKAQKGKAEIARFESAVHDRYEALEKLLE